jgi:hypothetical protein
MDIVIGVCLWILVGWYWIAGPGKGMKPSVKRAPRGSFNRWFGPGGTSELVPRKKASVYRPPTQHPAPRFAPSPPAPKPEPAHQLRKLAELHQDGLLTDEEFAVKRVAIVDKL